MRGTDKLKAISLGLFPDLEAQEPDAENKTLYEEKKKAICARYYYYICSKQGTYEDILQKLEKEFYISSRRIADIIGNETNTIAELREQKPQKSWFKSTFAHLVW
jgi:hypothetical protein